MHRLYIASDELEAHLLADFLQQSGVGADVFANIDATGATHHGTISYHAVWVLPEQAEEALGLLEQFLEQETARLESAASEESWICPGCGETIEPQFTLCWQCGHDQAAEGEPAPPFDPDADLDAESGSGRDPDADQRW
jgi:hypothetical protein